MENKSFLLQVNEAAYLGYGDTCLAKNQVGASGIHIDDDPYFGDGLIHTKELIGLDIPLIYEEVLTHFFIDKPTETDLESLHMVELTRYFPWNPGELP